MNTVQACPGPHLSDKKTYWLVSKGTVCCEPNVVPFRILALCITNLVLLCKLLNFAWFRHLSCLSISCSGREVNDKPTKGYQRFKNVQNYSDLNFSSIQHIQDRGLCLCVCVCVCAHLCLCVCSHAYERRVTCRWPECDRYAKCAKPKGLEVKRCEKQTWNSCDS